MKTFKTKAGVKSFETGGPEGLVRIEAGSPLSTDDQRVISVLEAAGARALDISDAADSGADKQGKGGER